MSSLTIEAVNAAHQPSLATMRRRAKRTLRPGEMSVLVRHHEHLTGRVLELSSRADGLTDALLHLAEDFTGLCATPAEAAFCRAELPHGRFVEANLADLDALEAGSFDAIVAGRFALDRLSHEHRCSTLGRLARLLSRDGVLILSSHNLACESLVRTPIQEVLQRPWRIGALPQSLANRARLARLQQREHGWGILNDAADRYQTLSYYVSREEQERQLAAHDLQLLECVDRQGSRIHGADPAYGQPELIYVAGL